MTVQPQDTEPEEQQARAPADFRHDPNFEWPERVPWSVLGEDFTQVWGRADTGNPQPEHLEIVGPTGSGKTYLLCTMLQQRMVKRETAAVLVCTKPADSTVLRLGWPIIDRPEDLNDNPNAIYWPRTKRMGNERREFHERKISDLLHKIWTPESNRIVAFDEVGYVESLSGDLKAIVQQYWREGRSQGITVVAMKQRPQGVLRDMHSETYWKAAFPPEDRGDLERWSELFGARRDWMPVFDSLDPSKREFIIRHSRSRESYISWVDVPLRPVKPPKRKPGWMGGNSRRAA